MAEIDSTRLDDLVLTIAASPKYRAVAPELIRNIGARELAVRRNQKEAIKAAKNKLHQIAGAYLDSKPQYAIWLDRLANHSGDNEQLRDTCLEIMRHHASTNERSGILDSFYATTLRNVPPIYSVLDVACGFNPLAIPWMPLAEGCHYYACDIYTDLVAFLNQFFPVLGISGRATTCDLVAAPPDIGVDLALVLKILPLLDQQANQGALKLLQSINATYLLVSFPARSLGGRSKGMVEHYESRFLKLVEEQGWHAARFVFSSELAFLVQKDHGASAPDVV